MNVDPSFADPILIRHGGIGRLLKVTSLVRNSGERLKLQYKDKDFVEVRKVYI